jgi:hypothetical protein
MADSVLSVESDKSALEQLSHLQLEPDCSLRDRVASIDGEVTSLGY